MRLLQRVDAQGAWAPRGCNIVLLTRLVPFFPFKLSNYFFGLTHSSLRGFVLGTIVAVVYLNRLAGRALARYAGDNQEGGGQCRG